MTQRKIPNLRWCIVGLLFISTVINYIDRQALSILARTIQNDLGMTDLDYASHRPGLLVGIYADIHLRWTFHGLVGNAG